MDALHHLYDVLGLQMRTIVGGRGDRYGLHLEVPPRLEGTQSAPEELVMITNGSFQFPTVDEVEGRVVVPLGFEIVNLETQVWWDPRPLTVLADDSLYLESSRRILPRRLDWTQVDSCHGLVYASHAGQRTNYSPITSA
jgi:hypothetical protein